MKITLKEYGGYAGLPGMKQTWSVDSRDLTPETGSLLAQLVEAASREPAHGLVPDAKSYVITVQNDGGETMIRQRDPLPPASVRLVEWLRQHAS
jgi:hypothetical protein